MPPHLCRSFLLVLAACGAEPAPMPPTTVDTPAATTSAAPAVPAATTLPAATLADDLLQGKASATTHEQAAASVAATALEVLRQAAAGDDRMRARAPQVLRGLGPDALPTVSDRLGNGSVTERRLAALTLLQWSDELHRQGLAAQVTDALGAAVDDPAADAAVRAAAEHALRRVRGDTSALDQSRADHDAALRRDQ
ncbi:MAG: hypothetical protein JNN13_15145 [Planctomycetes bacterium]|nr:hypothetical protein [Planctomycetota bacterium]